MKKIIALLLVTVLCLGMFAACNKKNEGPTDAEVLTRAFNVLGENMKAKNPEPRNDFDIPGQIKVEDGTYTIEWSCDNSAVKVVESTKAGFKTVDLPDKTDAAISFTLTAKITVGETSDSKSYSFTMTAFDNSGITNNPVEGTAYKLFMNQATLDKKFFALNTTQDNKNKYINTTTDATKAPDFFVEIVEGGVKIYTEINGVKNYVYAQLVVENASQPDHKSKYLGFSTENATVFNYVQETNSWQTTIDGTKYVTGTYSTYNTFSISEATHITPENTGSSQFVLEFMTSEYAESLTPPPADVVLTTPEEILTAAYALEANKALGKYTLTGIITSVDTAYDSGYGNVTVTMVVNNMTDKPIQAFRLKGTGADKIAVGDEITVTGDIINYTSFNDDGSVKSSKVEFNSGCTLDSWKDNTTEQGGNTGSTDTTVFGKTQLDAAYALADGESITGPFKVTGKITALDNWNNPTIVIDNNTDKPVYCFKLVVTAAVGDTITFTAKTIKNYQGTIEFMDCTLESSGNNSGNQGSNTDLTTPEAMLNAAYALQQTETLTGPFTLTGIITKVTSSYSATENNISVQIVVNNNTAKPIVCFKLTGEGCESLAVGDQITATGNFTNFYGTIELIDCTLDSWVDNTTGEVAPDPVLDANKVYVLSVVGTDGVTYYASGIDTSAKTLKVSTSASDALQLHFEATGNKNEYYIYYMNNGAKAYLAMSSNATKAMTTVSSPSGADAAWTIDFVTYQIINSTHSRAFAFYNNADIRTYAKSGSYVWVWYAEA